MTPSRFCLLLCVPAFATGCFVPQNRYDDAVQRLHSEERAHATDAAELARIRAELGTVNQALGTKERTLADREGELAQRQLDSDRMTTERDDAVLLVEQLRGELGRASDHLREFSDQKKSLEAALGEADERAKRLERAERAMAEKALVVRDLTLALGPSIDAGKAAITVLDGKPALRLPARLVFSESGGALGEASKLTLARVAAVLSAHPTSKVELGDRTPGELSPEDRITRLQRVADVLVDQGIGFERIGFAVAAPAETADRPVPTDAKPAAAKPETPAPAAKAPVAQAEEAFRDGPGSVEIVVDVVLPG